MQQISEIIKELIPPVLIAGDYARAIQSRVARHEAKAAYSGNSFAEALTDADLCVQNFLEVFLLARFPELSFFGEEHEQSLNTKYFREGGELTVLVDPIDGTRFYADNRDYFNVILSIVDKTGYQGAVLYMPVLEQCIWAARGEGCFSASPKELRDGHFGRPLQLAPNATHLLTYRCPEALEALRGVGGHEIFDIDVEYTRRTDCPNINAMFFGEACGFIGKHMNMIDWGVQAFLVEEAGGVVSDWQGAPLPKLDQLTAQTFPQIVAAADAKLHELIVERL